MAEYTLYTPMSLNSGASVSPGFFVALGERLAGIAGGYTRVRGVGAYVMADGTVKREPVYVYTLFAPDVPSTRERIRSVAQHVKIQLAQESVLFTVRAVDSELV